MQTKKQYAKYRKPSWAPPSWIFGPVWTTLYILIAISYGYVVYLYIQHQIPLLVLVPFALNLLFNAVYTPLQFTIRRPDLATIDIFLVDATLVWALIAIYPYAAWVSYLNVPYLAWASFATVLQVTVFALNAKRHS